MIKGECPNRIFLWNLGFFRVEICLGFGFWDFRVSGGIWSFGFGASQEISAQDR